MQAKGKVTKQSSSVSSRPPCHNALILTTQMHKHNLSGLLRINKFILKITAKLLIWHLCSQGAASESADDSGSDVATPNTVYAREVAQLFVSGRHNQFRDASSRFGSLEGSRTLSSRALQIQMQAPTPSLPSSESIGQ